MKKTTQTDKKAYGNLADTKNQATLQSKQNQTTPPENQTSKNEVAENSEKLYWWQTGQYA